MRTTLIYFNWFNLFDVDIFLIIIGYFIIIKRDIMALLYGWLFGTFIDIVCAGPYGIFTGSYILVFIILRLAANYFHTKPKAGQIFYIFTGSLIKYLFMISLLLLFNFNPELTYRKVVFLIGSSLLTAMISPFLIHLFNLLSKRFLKETSYEV